MRLSWFIVSLVLVSLQSFADQVTPIDSREIKAPLFSQPIHHNHESVAKAQGFFHAPVRHNNPRNRPIFFQVTHYQLAITVDPLRGSIMGHNHLTIQATEDQLTTISLDAFDMQIHSVVSSDDEELPLTYDGEVLVIALPRPMQRNETLNLTIFYQVEDSNRLYLTGGDVTNPQRMNAAYTFTQPEGSRHWFPCLDRPNHKAELDIEISLPQGYNVLSNGYLLSLKQQGETVTFHYRMTDPISPYLVSLAIGQYELSYLGHYKGKPLMLWAPPAIHAQALRTTARTQKMMEVFSRFTGVDYPFASYSQSVAQAWYTSMEHQSATTMGGWRVSGDRTGEGVVAHELAHQWFGDWVTCDRWTELWLNEGFASYLPALYFAAIGEHNNQLGYEDYFREGYFREAKRKVRALSASTVDYEDLFDAHAYQKGALIIKLMHHLSEQMTPAGEEAYFTQALRHYLQHHGGKNVRNTDLQKALEKITGRNWQLFFDQFIRAEGHPLLHVVWQQQPQTNELKLTLTQKQVERKNQPWGLYQFPLEVELIGLKGERQLVELQVYDHKQEFTLSPDFAVGAVALDPHWWVPSENQVEQEEAAEVLVLTHSPSVRARIDALRQILQRYQKTVLPSKIAELIVNDPSSYLQVEALAILSANTVHCSVIGQIVLRLQERKKRGRIADAGLKKAEAWLVQHQKADPSPADVRQWQKQYLEAENTWERKASLTKLVRGSLSEAQQFALERLQEPHWVTRDRFALIDVLTEKPSEVSAHFIAQALQGATYRYRRDIMAHLVRAQYDRPELVSLLIAQAQTERYIAIRGSAIDLLAVQKSSQEKVCAFFDELPQQLHLPVEERIFLEDKLGKAQERLCSAS